MALNDRRWLAAGAAGLLAITLLAIGVTLLATGNSQPVPRARQYTASRACLLTDSHGITAAPAATVWAGMEDASLDTHAKVTYLAANGPATAAHAVPYANSLIEQKCDVILAVGGPQAGAIAQVASRTPATTFVVVGSGTSFATANLKTVGLSADTRGQVKQTVESLVNR